jgi:hypothetical protein
LYGEPFPHAESLNNKKSYLSRKRIEIPINDPKKQKYNPFAVHIFGVLAPKSGSIVERSQWPGGY